MFPNGMSAAVVSFDFINSYLASLSADYNWYCGRHSNCCRQL